DRFLLGGFEALGLFNELFGGLRGAGLQLPCRNDPMGFGRGAGVGAPERDRADAKYDDDKSDRRNRDRLSTETRDGPGIPGGEFDHANANPDVISMVPITTGRAALKPGICGAGGGFRANHRKNRAFWTENGLGWGSNGPRRAWMQKSRKQPHAK